MSLSRHFWTIQRSSLKRNEINRVAEFEKNKKHPHLLLLSLSFVSQIMRKALREPWSILQMHWVTAVEETALWRRHNKKPTMHVRACLRCHETQTTDRFSCHTHTHMHMCILTNILTVYFINWCRKQQNKIKLLIGSPERWKPCDSALVLTADLWKVGIKSRQTWTKTVLMVTCEGILLVKLIFHCIQMSSGGTSWCIFDETRSLLVMDARCASAGVLI